MASDQIDQNDLDLDFVRVKRKEIISSLTEKGVPRDLMAVQTLMGALADMDRAALNRKKIKVDKEVGDKHNEAIELIATIFANPVTKQLGKSDVIIDMTLPVLGNDIEKPVLVDGEIDSRASLEDFESFTNRMSPL